MSYTFDVFNGETWETIPMDGCYNQEEDNSVKSYKFYYFNEETRDIIPWFEGGDRPEEKDIQLLRKCFGNIPFNVYIGWFDKVVLDSDTDLFKYVDTLNKNFPNQKGCKWITEKQYADIMTHRG